MPTSDLRPRRRALALALVRWRARCVAALAAGLVLVSGCVQPAPSTIPSPPASISPSPTASAPASSSAAPSDASTPSSSPSVVPSASGSPGADCRVEPSNGRLSSNRLIDVRAATTPEGDQFTFLFGNATPGPGGIPTGELSLATPPYTFGASGLPINMTGHRVIQVVFRQMSLMADTGDPVYTGPAQLKANLPVLRHAVEFDESEGVIGWYLGFNGSGCVTLSQGANTVVITFAGG